MVKIKSLIKENLLGFAVALGVCIFVYEGLIRYSTEFTLTKYAGVFIILVALYTRYKENLAFLAKKDQNASGKEK